ncbi:(Fe-S)-binding protein [Stratiformator vulcanicus]|uniref:Lactate utilization protein A n=1 Tax=Stratiformator vulcanicus TaxID=2527980 RepID=A0A517QX35_9PLAN|nr:(Fe-S)-binding protein [Stratiformator vulcanicus]QDT36226.1 Lactate utilization protein A [Stratiformator vulcanicus]
MRVALFVPCYIDQLYPDVAMATVRVLRHFGITDIDFPEAQTCCGQPMANTGCTSDAAPLARRFFDTFRGYDAVVCPSGSCTAMVREHYGEYFGPEDSFSEFKKSVYELTEFLVDVLKIERPPGSFPHKVGIHNSCHGLRELRLGSDSERMDAPFSKTGILLEGLDGIELVDLKRIDECCGFGGTFAVSEEAVSCMMGTDRIVDHEQAGAEIITAGDMSCLMHMDGLIRRQERPLKVMHIAEILERAMLAGSQKTGARSQNEGASVTDGATL